MVPSVLALATQHLDWLASRQAIVARNVAKANTPGYKAQDVQPFSAMVDQGGLQMTTTNPGHISIDMSSTSSVRATDGNSWEISQSGNSVTLEQEMIKASDIHRSYSLDTAITRSFHQMLNMAAK